MSLNQTAKYFVCIIIRKGLFKKGYNRHPGEMVLLHYINNNILISNPSLLGVYQEEYEN